MLENAQVGQKAVRKMRNGKGETWQFDAEVISISSDYVTVLVFADQPRTMFFDTRTGVNNHGEEYGWLELIPA